MRMLGLMDVWTYRPPILIQSRRMEFGAPMDMLRTRSAVRRGRAS